MHWYFSCPARQGVTRPHTANTETFHIVSYFQVTQGFDYFPSITEKMMLVARIAICPDSLEC